MFAVSMYNCLRILIRVFRAPYVEFPKMIPVYKVADWPLRLFCAGCSMHLNWPHTNGNMYTNGNK